MSDIKISVETTRAPAADKDITVIRVDGVIDTMTASELEKVANSLLSQKRYNIIIDLGGVDYISSAGWGIFISNIREIRINNGDIKLARMIPNVYEIFELLEFDSILKAFDNIEKAKADFGASVSPDLQRIEIMEPKPVPVGRDTSARPETKTDKINRPSIVMGDSQPSNTQSREVKSPEAEATRTDLPPVTEPRPAARKVLKLEDALMEVVGKDPFLSINEIKKAVSKNFPKLGFLKTWWTLRRLGLSSKKKRFYFARTRRFSK
jgi:anti-sigma B factor antagonist